MSRPRTQPQDLVPGLNSRALELSMGSQAHDNSKLGHSWLLAGISVSANRVILPDFAWETKRFLLGNSFDSWSREEGLFKGECVTSEEAASWCGRGNLFQVPECGTEASVKTGTSVRVEFCNWKEMGCLSESRAWGVGHGAVRTERLHGESFITSTWLGESNLKISASISFSVSENKSLSLLCF